MQSAESESYADNICPLCGALPIDQVNNPDFSQAITILYTHGLITESERNRARRKLAK